MSPCRCSPNKQYLWAFGAEGGRRWQQVPQLESPPGSWEDSPGSIMRSASLPRLRPKAIFGQGPAGQPRGLGDGAEALPPGLSAPHPPGWKDWKRAWGVEKAPRLLCWLSQGPAHLGAGKLPAPSSLQLERSSKSPRDLGRGLMALLTTDASSLRNQSFCVSSPHSWLPGGA